MSLSIKIEHLSKQYKLGLISTSTISSDLNRWWNINVKKRDDAFLKYGVNKGIHNRQLNEYIWALNDINLEIHKGAVLGIIGKNGAGKSTLLKIISKITSPTNGIIKAKGRISGLLEIGTGFHPEMTGRENIYMNGAILGMSKIEISRKLDEIIDFAGIEQFIDTPVKRYSSGMTVRLGFAVAANLEPDILVVDEVLAVGDAEFQKKAMMKMQDINCQKGRTILFVSHNLGAVRDICPNSVILDKGHIFDLGDSTQMIEKYLAHAISPKRKFSKKNVTVTELILRPDPAPSSTPIYYTLRIHSSESELINSIGLLIFNQLGQRIAIVDLRVPGTNYRLNSNQELKISGQLKNLPLVEGIYNIGLFYMGNFIHENILDLFSLHIINENKQLVKYPAEVRGYVDLNNDFTYEIV